MDSLAFRRALGHFPTGVTVVTTRSRDGGPLGLTANSFTSVSLDPALVSWSLRRRSALFDAFCEARWFAINVLAANQAALASRFAAPCADRFADVETRAGLGSLPLLPGCIAHFECATAGCHLEGDHAIFIGRVERFSTGATEETPLLFCKGAYMVPQPVLA
jgi:flavin reductase (DIM6/NTAB) family NADH-FMN oxidoreductase RutF